MKDQEILKKIHNRIYPSEVLTHSEEFIRWHVAANEIDLSSKLSWSERKSLVKSGQQSLTIKPLLEKSLQEARDRSEVWNPLLDALSQLVHWEILAEEHESFSTNERVPSPKEHLGQLSSWLQTASSREVSQLLKFSSPYMHAFVYENYPDIKALPLNSLQKDFRVFEALVSRSDLTSAQQQQLLENAYLLWREKIMEYFGKGPALKSFMKSAREDEREFLKETIPNTGLPSSLYEQLVADFRLEGFPDKENVTKFLLSSKDLPENILFELYEKALWENKKAICTHPSATSDLRRKIFSTFSSVGDRDIRIMILADDTIHNRFSKKVIEDVAASPVEDPKLASYLIRSSKVPLKKKKAFFDSFSSDSGVRSAAAWASDLRHDREVREVLLGSTAENVLTGLIQDATAEEFPKLMKALMKKSTSVFVEALDTAKIPEGVKIPQEIIQKMLKQGSKSERLIVTTKLIGSMETNKVLDGNEKIQKRKSHG